MSDQINSHLGISDLRESLRINSAGLYAETARATLNLEGAVQAEIQQCRQAFGDSDERVKKLEEILKDLRFMQDMAFEIGESLAEAYGYDWDEAVEEWLTAKENA